MGSTQKITRNKKISPQDSEFKRGEGEIVLLGMSRWRSNNRHRTDERNSREKHRLWISRAYRETQTLNPEKTYGKPKKIKQNSPENQRNTETLENPTVFLSGACLYILQLFQLTAQGDAAKLSKESRAGTQLVKW